MASEWSFLTFRLQSLIAVRLAGWKSITGSSHWVEIDWFGQTNSTSASPSSPALVLNINIYIRASLRASFSKIGFTGRSKWKEGQFYFFFLNRLWDNIASLLHPVHTNVFALPIPIKTHALLHIGFHNKVCPLQNRSKCVHNISTLVHRQFNTSVF